MNCRPTPYYAVLKLDGDNMGKWLSGELLPEIEYAYSSEVWKVLPEKFKKELREKLKKIDGEAPKKLLTPAVHASISVALRNYALEFVKEIVEKEHLGKLVYAGGDDVLAFVNLRDLFSVMHKLRAAFSGHIRVENGKIEVDWKNTSGFVEKNGMYLLTMGASATASMGVVIAHYKTPLQTVIEKADKALQKAKSAEKDSFCIVLMKIAGEERVSKFKWRYDANFDTLAVLKELSLRFDRRQEKKEGYFSLRFVYKLNQEFAKLKEKSMISLSSAIFEAELQRLLERSYSGNKRGQERKKLAQQTAEKLIQLYHNGEFNFDYFVNVLLTLDLIQGVGYAD